MWRNEDSPQINESKEFIVSSDDEQLEWEEPTPPEYDLHNLVMDKEFQ